MKKFTLLLTALLMLSLSAMAQIKMYIHLDDGTRVEYIASRVDSITFDSQIVEPDDEDKPEEDKPDTPVGPKPDPGTPDANGHEYVDLGLPSGVLWATCNVGTDSPEGYGDYFAWGETEPKAKYDWSTYKWCNGDDDSMTKYCTDSYYGRVDNKTILELSDDAANANWGGDWRMPTTEEQNELLTECSWTWITQNGVYGYKVTSKTNGNSIFLPAAGYRYDSDLSGVGSCGYYWSSSRCYTNDLFRQYYAYGLHFDLNEVGWHYNFNSSESRRYGRSVRPVLRVGFTYDATFDSNGGEGTMPSIAINHAEVLSIPENKFTHPGYEFICWNTKADGTGTNYEDGGNISVASDITLYAQWYRKETNITHEYVDLGLSVKWATCNVGASKPEEAGYFFAWGETLPKSTYNWETYKWCEVSYYTQTKYCTDSYYGTVDNKTILELSDDAANANWGSDWRMPTKTELDELRTKCTWNWASKNGVNGYYVTGPNGNSIFLPAVNVRENVYLYKTGSEKGFYWSSSLYNNNDDAYDIGFDSDGMGVSNHFRGDGRSVRPVMP